MPRIIVAEIAGEHWKQSQTEISELRHMCRTATRMSRLYQFWRISVHW